MFRKCRTESYQSSKKVGLKINTEKTKYIKNENDKEQEVKVQINNTVIEQTLSYIYLDQII